MRLLSLLLICSSVETASGQTPEPGRRLFENNCGICHGADATGGEMGPAILQRLPNRTDPELTKLIHEGLPARGMPASNLGSQETTDLLAFLRSLRPRRRSASPVRLKIETTDGKTLEGLVLNQSIADLQLRTDDGRVHLFRPSDLVGNAAGGFNRGVAWSGDRVLMVTDHAHLIALNRFTGALEWETEMADWRQNYNATSAPLVAGDLVISGTAGGEQGARGFIAAYNRNSGKEVWRFWTVPKPGDPGSETWKGKAIEHPSAVAWFTGAYDPQLGILYWPTGNPGPDYNDEERGGDNLYSCSIVALDVKTGALKWHYQFTPHDVYDWDATEPPVLLDMDWRGQARKLLIQANRNGFFYVLDRTSGKLLLAEPFVKKLNWASKIGPDGRPVLNPPETLPNGGTKVCPAQSGATNWFSTSFNPSTGLYYVQSLERCNIYVKKPTDWEAGRSYLGGSSRPVPGEIPQKVLRALDVKTGRIAWELPQSGPALSWGGTLSTASGLVFFGEDSGMFMAVDAAGGKPLWQFLQSEIWRASPMTYMFDGKQYIAVAAGQNIIAFALGD